MAGPFAAMPNAETISGLLHDLAVPEVDARRFADALAGALAGSDLAHAQTALKAVRKLQEARKGLAPALKGAALLAFLAFVYTALSENENDRIQQQRIKERERER